MGLRGPRSSHKKFIDVHIRRRGGGASYTSRGGGMGYNIYGSLWYSGRNPGSPPPGGRAAVPTRRPSPTLLFLGLFLPKMVKNPIFRGGVKKWSKNGPKMAKKFTGVPQKMPKNPKNFEKMDKNGTTEPRVIALKRVKMH